MNLEDAIREAGGPVDLLWNSTLQPSAVPRVPTEFTNWRSEQLAWRRSAVLFDQSHHMVDLIVAGKDAERLLSDLAVNSFANFPVDRAKQFVAVAPDGHLIGDNILFHLAEDEYQLVGIPTSLNWVQYHAETQGYDVDLVRDENSHIRAGDPLVYRYEIQGPSALDVIRDATGIEPPVTKFFGMTELPINGRRVRALRHGMVGEPGYEIWGPWSEREAVLDALLEAGRKHDLVRVGGLAYHTNSLESGWFSRPMPGIYADDRLAEYRRWLQADSYEATAPLGGSFRSERIEDYYFSPFDLDYGRIVKFDHDFIGRDALEEAVASGRSDARRKVTLVFDGEAVTAAIASNYEPGIGAKYFKMPMAHYASFQYDQVLKDGRNVGSSVYPGYTANYRSLVSLAIVDREVAEPGTRVEVLWGEEPNSSKSQVEPHRQVVLRATVHPAPLDENARNVYRQN